MRYQISRKQIDIGSALQVYVKNELGALVRKYAERSTYTNVAFSKNAHQFSWGATAHVSTGLRVPETALATEIYAALDIFNDKMEKQQRRYKRRLKGHHNERKQPVELSSASSYILAHNNIIEDSEPESLQPVINVETEAQIPMISVGQAAMQIELAGSQFLLFRNEGKKSVNIVYLRDDGNIGWVEPQ